MRMIIALILGLSLSTVGVATMASAKAPLRDVKVIDDNMLYVALALAVNTPGNSIIGGGGGILMLAGVLRLFHWSGILLTLMIATLPIPLAVFVIGTEFLSASPD